MSSCRARALGHVCARGWAPPNELDESDRVMPCGAQRALTQGSGGGRESSSLVRTGVRDVERDRVCGPLAAATLLKTLSVSRCKLFPVD